MLVASDTNVSRKTLVQLLWLFFVGLNGQRL